MFTLPAVRALGEPPVALVNTARRPTDEVPEQLVTVAGSKPALPRIPAVRTEAEVMKPSVSLVVPTTSVSAVVPANAVVTFAIAFSTNHLVGVEPRVNVTVSDAPVAPVAVRSVYGMLNLWEKPMLAFS